MKLKGKKGTIEILVVFFICTIFLSCNPYGKGDKILTVNITDNDSAYFSDVEVIKESLVKGGRLTLNVTVLEEIDPDVVSKYGVVSSEGRYSLIPVIVNFVGANGWHLLQVLNPDGASIQSLRCEYCFVKAR